MIAVDTSALMAVLLGEPEADACSSILASESDIIVSAGTVAEALIVAGRRNLSEEMSTLIEELGFRIIDVTPPAARRIAQAYAEWGKGSHPASLNLGDCFAYEVAKTHGCKLLFVGDDFSRTDLSRAF